MAGRAALLEFRGHSASVRIPLVGVYSIWFIPVYMLYSRLLNFLSALVPRLHPTSILDAPY